MRDHDPEELSHYSNATTDIEFLFPFGWGELWGIADRTDFDLKAHSDHSGKELAYRDPETNEKYIPYCIEPSLGADRVLLAFLVNAYEEETLANDEKSTDDKRTVMHLHPALSPFKAAILPLTKKQADVALELHAELAKHFMVDYDVAGNIGKRYRREDEIGTPYCITVDFDTEVDSAVTVRDRDTMEQVRIPMSEVKDYIEKSLEF
jgi:glycyl-tRNA synthetase